MKTDQSGASRTVLSITGMTCGGCANTVTRVLQRVPGVTRAEVDLASARARVEGTARPAELVAAAEGAGFGATVLEA
jgi:copper chaperone CopZ